MTDKEKVIRGLAEVSEYTRAKADIAGVGKGKEIFDSWFRAAEDAIALLREQEPVKPQKALDGVWSYERCGACGNVLYERGFAYCPWCGKAVKWNEDD